MAGIDGFEGKNVFITGAADGIGLALAKALQHAGARVFLCDIAAEKLEKAAAEIGAPSAPCDVADAPAIERVVEQAWSELGPLDLVCANAGVFRAGSVLEASAEDIAYQFDVNVWGMLHTLRPAVRKLRAAERGGYLLLTGSENSLSTPSYLRKVPAHVYNMTKHAVISMADGLRTELAASGIGVSVLCPGPVVSGLLENSGTYRPVRYGGAATFELDVAGGLGEEEIQRLAGLYIPPERAAEIVLEGLRRGLFVIPTHPHELDDATLRFREIERGFAVL